MERRAGHTVGLLETKRECRRGWVSSCHGVEARWSMSRRLEVPALWIGVGVFCS